MPVRTATLNAATANDAVDFGGAYLASRAGIQLEGFAGGAIVTFESTINNVDWYAHLVSPNGSATDVTTASADGVWTIDLAGRHKGRVRISTVGTGTITVSDFAVGG